MNRNYYYYNGIIRGLGPRKTVLPHKVLLGHHREGGVLFGKDVADELNLPWVYLYEENNRFYEFFSGDYLCTLRGNSLIREPIGLCLTEIGRDYGTLDYDIKSTPPHLFAKAVQELQGKMRSFAELTIQV